MSDIWTALDNATTFDLMPELGADGNPVDSSQNKTGYGIIRFFRCYHR